MRSIRVSTFALCVSVLTLFGCSDDEHGDETHSEADHYGVGAACDGDAVCDEYEDFYEETGSESFDLVCLSQFAGGYCGLEGCSGNDDCPDEAACVAHDDGKNYCFRRCTDKAECNENRPVDAESNCSANVEFVDANTSGKACVPPSSG
jgi:hypothetical protein